MLFFHTLLWSRRILTQFILSQLSPDVRYHLYHLPLTRPSRRQDSLPFPTLLPSLVIKSTGFREPSPPQALSHPSLSFPLFPFTLRPLSPDTPYTPTVLFYIPRAFNFSSISFHSPTFRLPLTSSLVNRRLIPTTYPECYHPSFVTNPTPAGLVDQSPFPSPYPVARPLHSSPPLFFFGLFSIIENPSVSDRYFVLVSTCAPLKESSSRFPSPSHVTSKPVPGRFWART